MLTVHLNFDVSLVALSLKPTNFWQHLDLQHGSQGSDRISTAIK